MISDSAEKKPHIVFPKGSVLYGSVKLFPTYLDAFSYWLNVHTWQNPYVIHTVGRECTVAAEVVNVNE
jgi:hypothetical protein